jgi:acyl-CoA dehydrogenase
VGRIDDALLKVIAAEPLEKRVHDALKQGVIVSGEETQILVDAVMAGILSEQEAVIVSSAQEARREVVRVDDFPREYWHKGDSHER